MRVTILPKLELLGESYTVYTRDTYIIWPDVRDLMRKTFGDDWESQDQWKEGDLNEIVEKLPRGVHYGKEKRWVMMRIAGNFNKYLPPSPRCPLPFKHSHPWLFDKCRMREYWKKFEDYKDYIKNRSGRFSWNPCPLHEIEAMRDVDEISWTKLLIDIFLGKSEPALLPRLLGGSTKVDQLGILYAQRLDPENWANSLIYKKK